MPADPIVNFRAPPAIRQQLVRVAEANGRTLSDELRIAVFAHLAHFEAEADNEPPREEIDP